MADHNEQDASTYAKLAGFDGDWRDDWWNQDYLELTARRTKLAERRRILDIGCGIGHWGLRLLPLAAPDATLIGVDREEAFLDDARARAEARGHADRSSFQHAHGESLPFEDDSFDMVTCQTVLMHAADASVVMREMLRVLQPGGLILLSEPDNASSLLSVERGTPEPSLSDMLSLTRMRLVCGRGKLAMGHGDENIGAQLPGLLHDLGATDIDCWTNDRAAMLLPPYKDPRQARDVEFLEASLTNLGVERALEESRWVAGGGAAEDFAELWDVMVRNRRRQLIATQKGKRRRGGAFVHYLVAGHAP